MTLDLALFPFLPHKTAVFSLERGRIVEIFALVSNALFGRKHFCITLRELIFRELIFRELIFAVRGSEICAFCGTNFRDRHPLFA